jgi:hypothetical protein
MQVIRVVNSTATSNLAGIDEFCSNKNRTRYKINMIPNLETRFRTGKSLETGKTITVIALPIKSQKLFELKVSYKLPVHSVV